MQLNFTSVYIAVAYKTAVALNLKAFHAAACHWRKSTAPEGVDLAGTGSPT
jgi:hypothetical protein